MFLSKCKGDCNEARCIVNYVNSRMEGERVSPPEVKYDIHQSVYELFERFFKNEETVSGSAKELLELVTRMSSFDVNMSQISYDLKDYAEEIAELSESNLAIVEETTASMNEVSEAVSDTSLTLERLASSSEELINSNNESIQKLSEINDLKEKVMENSSVMSAKIEELVELTNKVNEIVSSVGEIAEQTNLLSLNASIEAARAGENGKGFAVVASEIRKLADNTKKSLDGMSAFMTDIVTAAENGKASMVNTLESSSRMSGKIEDVYVTTKNNMELLNKTVEDVRDVNTTMEGVKTSTNEINIAMEASSRDAEKLNLMTQTIYTDSEQSAEFAKQITLIDDGLSEITRKLYKSLKGGRHNITNDEFVINIRNARKAHINWMNTLKKIIDEHKVYPLQVNSSKCAFGHFYYSISVNNSAVSDDWAAMEIVHNKFHTCGHDVIDAVKEGRMEDAGVQYAQAEKLSQKIFELLEQIEEKAKEQTKAGMRLIE